MYGKPVKSGMDRTIECIMLYLDELNVYAQCALADTIPVWRKVGVVQELLGIVLAQADSANDISRECTRCMIQSNDSSGTGQILQSTL
jgi:hypothetical protein